MYSLQESGHSLFDLVLRLVDFSGLRPELAHLLGWTSAQGQVPFDPVSLFLFVSWRLVNGWSRAQALRNLRHPRYADYAAAFGFRGGDFPTEGGVRYFLTTLGRRSDEETENVADASDKDQAKWTDRGYDDKGRPVCTFGYSFTANGFDSQRQSHKWFCGQACLNGKSPRVQLNNVDYPPQECPYQG